MTNSIISQVNESKIGVKSITIKKKDAKKLDLKDGDYVRIKKLEENEEEYYDIPTKKLGEQPR